MISPIVGLKSKSSAISPPRVAEDSAAKFDGAGLLQAITLEQVMIGADGQYFFAFADGDLLGGHAIEVTGYLDRGPTDLGLFG
jgi:hypothetical protein